MPRRDRICGRDRPGSAASINVSSQNLTPYRTCTVTAATTSTSAVADAVVSESSANTALGGQTTLAVESKPNGNQRTYIKFDLSGCTPSIPSGATVRLATLRLYASSLPSSCPTNDIFAVTSSWSDTSITWNNQPFGTTLNNPASGSRTRLVRHGYCRRLRQPDGRLLTGANVTSDVAAFVAGTATNNGWMIRDDTERAAPPRTTTFSAKNLGTVSQAPQLIVTYVTTP